MRIAIYGRVSTSHQVEHQTIEQQLGRLTAYAGAQAAAGWALRTAAIRAEPNNPSMRFLIVNISKLSKTFMQLS